jgi:chromosome segregation ATPase
MAALAATNSATPSLQSTLIRSRLEAARREAEQAQATVNELRSQVDAAETDFEKRQDTVRNLTNQSSQTDPTYQSKVQTSQSAVPVKTQELLFGLYNATSAKREATGNGLKSDPNAAPVVNTQGQATGRIVNVSA